LAHRRRLHYPTAHNRQPNNNNNNNKMVRNVSPISTFSRIGEFRLSRPSCVNFAIFISRLLALLLSFSKQPQPPRRLVERRLPISKTKKKKKKSRKKCLSRPTQPLNIRARNGEVRVGADDCPNPLATAIGNARDGVPTFKVVGCLGWKITHD